MAPRLGNGRTGLEGGYILHPARFFALKKKKKAKVYKFCLRYMKILDLVLLTFVDHGLWPSENYLDFFHFQVDLEAIITIDSHWKIG